RATRHRPAHIAHSTAPTNAYDCADGDLLCIAANTTRLFRQLARVIGRADLADDPQLATNEGRVKRADELDGVISAWTETRDSEDVVLLLREHHIPVSRINSVADIVTDPQFRARQAFVDVENPRLERPMLVPGEIPKLS